MGTRGYFVYILPGGKRKLYFVRLDAGYHLTELRNKLSACRTIQELKKVINELNKDNFREVEDDPESEWWPFIEYILYLDTENIYSDTWWDRYWSVSQLHTTEKDEEKSRQFGMNRGKVVCRPFHVGEFRPDSQTQQQSPRLLQPRKKKRHRGSGSGPSDAIMLGSSDDEEFHVSVNGYCF